MTTTIAHYTGQSGKVLAHDHEKIVVWNYSTGHVATWPAAQCDITTITSGPDGDHVSTKEPNRG